MIYLGAGLAAGVAGALVNWRRLSPSDPAEGALAGFWSSEFDTPGDARLAARSLRGRPLVLNFWATWCPPCVTEMPELDRFARDFAPKGWQVLGLAIDQADAVRRFLAATPVSFPIVITGTAGLELVRALGNATGGLPFTVVLDSDGQVRHRKMGATDHTELAAWAGSGSPR